MNRLATLVLVLGLALTACGGPEVGAAPELELGRDICEECGMIISDERFASGFVDDGGSHVFDEVAGLLLHLTEEGRVDDVAVWVKDYGRPEWIEAESAYFVRATGIRSPMEFGIAAFEEHSDAVRFAEDIEGALLAWSDLKADAASGMISAHEHDTADGGMAEGMDHDDEDHDMEEGDDEHDH